MDGWENVPGSNNQNNDHLAWAQYHEEDIPNYWAYANTLRSAITSSPTCSGRASPAMPSCSPHKRAGRRATPTPQHPYWGCDESSSDTINVLDNQSCSTKQVFPCFNIPCVPDVLPAGVGWRFYGSNFYQQVKSKEIWSTFDAFNPIRNGPGWSHVVNVSQFKTDIKDHTLPNVTWLVPQDLNCEHPGYSVCTGENWTVDNINAVMQSDYWKSTAIVFTMDDFGGWFDHVRPPRNYGCDQTHPYGLGFRLPLSSSRPTPSRTTSSRKCRNRRAFRASSRRCSARWPLSTLDPAAQDGQANDLMDAFDFNQTPIPPMPLTLRTCPP